MKMLEDALCQIDPQFKGLKDVVLAMPDDRINVIIVDQFEEIFTQSASDEREEFLRILNELPAFADLRTHIVITLRSDFLNEVFNIRPLWEIVKQGVELRGLSDDELRDAIQKPIQVKYPKNRFAPDLLEKLVKDASGDPALLPLLQVTLAELWKSGSLILLNYGNITDAIRKRAELVFNFTDHEDNAPVKRRTANIRNEIIDIFLDLVNVSPSSDDMRDVRQRRTRVSLERGSQQRRHLIEELIRSRLLASSSERQGGNMVYVVDIIHESLIENWARLKNAIDNRRQLLQRRARFELQMKLWLENDRNDEYLLLTKTQIAEAQALEDKSDIVLLTPDGSDFYQRSLRRIKDEQQRKLFEAQMQAQRDQDRAEELTKAIAQAKQAANRARAGELAAQSQSVLNRNPSLSLLLALEAIFATLFKNEPRVPSAEEALRGGIAKFVNPVLNSHNGQLTAMSISLNSRWLVTSGEDQTICIWDLTSGDRTKPNLVLAVGSVNNLIFSRDSRWLIALEKDSSVFLWDLAGDRGIIRAGKIMEKQNSLVEGERSLLIPNEKPIIVQDPIWRMKYLKGSRDGVGNSLTSPDGRWRVDWHGYRSYRNWTDDTISVYDQESGSKNDKVWKYSERDHPIQRLEFSPDSRWLVSVKVYLRDEKFSAHLFNPSSKDPIGSSLILQGHGGIIKSEAFSPDGHWFVTLDVDNNLRVWDLTSSDVPHSSVILRTDVGNNPNTYIDISQDSHWLALYSPKGVYLWTLHVEDLIEQGCKYAGRNFKYQEWREYFPGEEYRKTCKDWSLDIEPGSEMIPGDG